MCDFGDLRDGKLHIHLMLQFTADKERDTRQFFFEALKPCANSNDTPGEGRGRRPRSEYLLLVSFLISSVRKWLYLPKKSTKIPLRRSESSVHLRKQLDGR